MAVLMSRRGGAGALLLAVAVLAGRGNGDRQRGPGILQPGAGGGADDVVPPPNVNIFRDPRWGRGQETPGEDPATASKYGAAFVRGLQGTNSSSASLLQASACCKHITAYDIEEWKGVSRYNFNARVTAQDLADTFNPPFRSCVVDGKASCVMCAYTLINGVPACASSDLLTKTVRGEWKLNGYTASDCDAVAILHMSEHYTRTPEDAVAVALKAGLDINCGTYVQKHVAAAIQKGKLTEKEVDKALTSLFAIRMRLGHFDGDPRANKATALAKSADYVFLVMGLSQKQEQEGLDRTSLLLPGKQQSLITAVASAAKRPVILILLTGGPVDVTFAQNNPKIGAILWAGYPGQAGGQAIAQVLFGDHNPGGRLPVTWYPEEYTKIPMTDMRMRADPATGSPGRSYRFYQGKAVYKFGHGLSYSKFSRRLVSGAGNPSSYTKLLAGIKTTSTPEGDTIYRVDEIGADRCEQLKFPVTVEVQNHGPMDGKHSVLMFVRWASTKGGRPARQLVAFRSQHVRVGEKAKVTMEISPCEQLSRAREDGEKVIDRGSHFLMVEGDDELEIRFEA
uniref:Fibronectin type III-like domain-containing protein n=1 Tax=Oryza brachyantha TaxID=4533 RepID=J3KUB2_ORYBR